LALSAKKKDKTQARNFWITRVRLFSSSTQVCF